MYLYDQKCYLEDFLDGLIGHFTATLLVLSDEHFLARKTALEPYIIDKNKASLEVLSTENQRSLIRQRTSVVVIKRFIIFEPAFELFLAFTDQIERRISLILNKGWISIFVNLLSEVSRTSIWPVVDGQNPGNLLA